MVKTKAVIYVTVNPSGRVLARVRLLGDHGWVTDHDIVGRFKSVEHARWYLKLEFPDAEVKET